MSQSFEPSGGRVANVLVQKLLRAVEAEKQGLKNRVWPHLVSGLEARAPHHNTKALKQAEMPLSTC